MEFDAGENIANQDQPEKHERLLTSPDLTISKQDKTKNDPENQFCGADSIVCQVSCAPRL